jgi:hypothetical protein
VRPPFLAQLEQGILTASGKVSTLALGGTGALSPHHTRPTEAKEIPRDEPQAATGRTLGQRPSIIAACGCHEEDAGVIEQIMLARNHAARDALAIGATSCSR